MMTDVIESFVYARKWSEVSLTLLSSYEVISAQIILSSFDSVATTVLFGGM